MPRQTCICLPFSSVDGPGQAIRKTDVVAKSIYPKATNKPGHSYIDGMSEQSQHKKGDWKAGNKWWNLAKTVLNALETSCFQELYSSKDDRE